VQDEHSEVSMTASQTASEGLEQSGDGVGDVALLGSSVKVYIHLERLGGAELGDVLIRKVFGQTSVLRSLHLRVWAPLVLLLPLFRCGGYLTCSSTKLSGLRVESKHARTCDIE